MLKRTQWYQRMQEEDHYHRQLCTYLAKLEDIERGRDVHIHIIKLGLLEGNVFYENILIGEFFCYNKYGFIMSPRSHRWSYKCFYLSSDLEMESLKQ